MQTRNPAKQKELSVHLFLFIPVAGGGGPEVAVVVGGRGVEEVLQGLLGELPVVLLLVLQGGEHRILHCSATQQPALKKFW